MSKTFLGSYTLLYSCLHGNARHWPKTFLSLSLPLFSYISISLSQHRSGLDLLFSSIPSDRPWDLCSEFGLTVIVCCAKGKTLPLDLFFLFFLHSAFPLYFFFSQQFWQCTRAMRFQKIALLYKPRTDRRWTLGVNI